MARVAAVGEYVFDESDNCCFFGGIVIYIHLSE